jgi:hypothetical protein
MGHLLTFSIIHRTSLLRIAVSTGGQAQLLPPVALSALLAGTGKRQPSVLSGIPTVRW